MAWRRVRATGPIEPSAEVLNCSGSTSRGRRIEVVLPANRGWPLACRGVPVPGIDPHFSLLRFPMTPTPTTTATAPLVVRLRNPAIAALLGWLVPGVGHLYQGRIAKGILFLVTILTTFFYGLYLGDGKVVYASWRPGDTRWAYVCQVGVGLAALPALIQANRARDGEPAGFMGPPELPRDTQRRQWRRTGCLESEPEPLL